MYRPHSRSPTGQHDWNILTNKWGNVYRSLVHNHPSDDWTPSRADIEMTRAIVEVARPLGIAVHDHTIVGKGPCEPEGA
jgi:hypothetical protein